ncbi:MAG: glycosyltransferase family 4 protein [Candidatus Hodarchaeota archaeon]
MGLTGSGIYFYYIVKNLLKNGDKVYYISSTSTKHIESLRKDKNFKLIFIPLRKRIRFLQIGKFLFGFGIRDIIKKLIEDKKIDIIHINESFNPYYFLIQKIINKSNKRIRLVITAHGCTNLESKLIGDCPTINFFEKVAHKIYYPPLNFTEKLNLGTAQNIIAVTNGVLNNLLKIRKKFWKKKDGNINYKFIPNGIDINIFNIRAPDNQYLEKYKISEKDFVIVFTGGLVTRKNPEILIEIVYLLNKIKNLERTFKLIFVGGGRLENKLRSLIKRYKLENKVILEGYTKFENIPRILSIANLMIYSSIYETPGLSMLEAMAMKIPVIGANQPDINEVIIDETNGFLFDLKKSPHSTIIRKIKFILKNPEKIEEIVDNAYNNIKNNYNVLKTTEKVRKYYLNLISKLN